MTEVEEWRPVVGWEGLYEVSSLGRVRSLDRVVHDTAKLGVARCRTFYGKLLSLHIDRLGYCRVRLKRQAVAASRTVHSIVGEAFLVPKPVGCEIAHNDGNPSNAMASNLRWATRAENMADTWKHGTKQAGDNAPFSKLTAEQVATIRSSIGISQRDLARKYGVSQSAISAIKCGKIRNVPGYP